MKRLLLLNYEFPPLGGGASPVSYELAKRLSESGDYDIDVVTMRYRGLLAYETINPHLRVHRVPCLRSKKEICHPWEQLTYLVTGYFKAVSLIRKQPYDICHAHFIIPTGVLAYILNLQYKLPYAITSHGSDVPGFNSDRFVLLHKLIKPVLSLVTGRAKALTVPSVYLKDLLLSAVPSIYPEKILVIPNGVEAAQFQPGNKQKIIFSSGRLLKRKGFQNLIQALSGVDLGWSLHIAGDGPMLSELKAMAVVSKTPVVFHGWLNNQSFQYRNLLASASIFALLSKSESFGMVLVEALCAGCAVVTSNTTGCAEVVGEDGVQVNPTNIDGIKRALTRLMQDTDYLNAQQLRASNRSKKFDWPMVVDMYKKNI